MANMLVQIGKFVHNGVLLPLHDWGEIPLWIGECLTRLVRIEFCENHLEGYLKAFL